MKAFKRKLIIVSNREPYALRGKKYEKTVGGLVTALDPVMRATNGVWIAAGFKKTSAPNVRIAVPPDDPSYTLRRVPLDARDIEGYYNGYSNRFLWPLCHITLDRVNFSRPEWESYKRVNRLFAKAAAEEAHGEAGAVVWLQDYHLALCAEGIKSFRPDINVSLFWHIPWPPHAVFRICPHRKEVLKGLLANDLLAFQLDIYKFYFMGCVAFELGADIDFKRGMIRFSGHTTKLGAFPIGMDFKWFEEAADSAEGKMFIKRFLAANRLDGLLGLSVNRLDYTKGLIKCLDIQDVFFEKFTQYRGKMTFVQVCVPTRKVEPYSSYREQVIAKIKKINSKYSFGKWRPVKYIDGELTHGELAALYRVSDVAVVSSVYDGMNLVAKEYLASQIDMKGALLVSEFAGAAEDIPGVTLINPYDREGSAETIKKALEADPSVKRKALKLAREYLRKNDIYKWVDDILTAIKRLR